MTRPSQTELREPADLYSDYVWPFMCFCIGRESASIWLSEPERPRQVSDGKWDVLATNGGHEVKVNAYTG
jgi:hypothetical protein